MKVARSLEKLGYVASWHRDTRHVSEARACSRPRPKYALDQSIIAAQHNLCTAIPDPLMVIYQGIHEM